MKPAYKRLLWCGGVLLIAIIVNLYCELFPIHLAHRDNNFGIKVLSYNIHSQADGFGLYAPEIAKTIVGEKPDFVFLTEYYETSSDTLINSLEREYPYVEKTYRWENNEGDVFCSTWEIDTIDKYGVKGSFCSIYRVLIHKAPDTLAIYCCHLSSNNLMLNEGRWSSLKEGRRLRLTEADTIVNALRREKYPSVVIGDMNDVPFSPTIKRIKSTGLKDAWWNGGFGYGSTYHNDWLRLRIDYAFYDDKHLNLQNIDVIGEETWSDHRALVVGFNFK